MGGRSLRHGIPGPDYSLGGSTLLYVETQGYTHHENSALLSGI